MRKVTPVVENSSALPPVLQALLAYYACKMIAGRAPVRDEAFSAAALRTWLGSIALISCHESDYRCRLMGTKLLGRFGVELTGKSFSEVDAKLLGDLPDRTRRCAAVASPVFGRAVSTDGRVHFAELLLPLANRDGDIDTVLLASYPVPPNPAPESEDPDGVIV